MHGPGLEPGPVGCHRLVTYSRVARLKAGSLPSLAVPMRSPTGPRGPVRMVVSRGYTREPTYTYEAPPGCHCRGLPYPPVVMCARLRWGMPSVANGQSEGGPRYRARYCYVGNGLGSQWWAPWRCTLCPVLAGRWLLASHCRGCGWADGSRGVGSVRRSTMVARPTFGTYSRGFRHWRTHRPGLPAVAGRWVIGLLRVYGSPYSAS